MTWMGSWSSIAYSMNGDLLTTMIFSSWELTKIKPSASVQG